MYQYGRPHSSSHIGRARREKSEFRMVRKGDPRTDVAVNPIECSKGGAQLETGLERLEAQVILLVDHDAQAVRQIHGGSAAQWMLGLEPRQLLAHEVPLEQQRTLTRVQLV